MYVFGLNFSADPLNDVSVFLPFLLVNLFCFREPVFLVLSALFLSLVKSFCNAIVVKSLKILFSLAYLNLSKFRTIVVQFLLAWSKIRLKFLLHRLEIKRSFYSSLYIFLRRD